MTKRDYLTALPAELLHEIISYLFLTHEPDKAFFRGARTEEEWLAVYQCRHSLDRLAASSILLRAQVMDFAKTFLRRHKDITRYEATAARAMTKPRTNWLRGRGGLLWWIDRNCIFCGKASSRTAIMMNGFHCCRGCDDTHWPDKITKSAAREEYHLSDHHLLPHQQRTPISAKMLAKHPGGLPKLWYGTCMTVNTPTTYFLRKDVEALATLAHGDLKAHLAKRRVEREERSRKIRATKAVKYEKQVQRAREIIQAGAAARAAASSVAGSSAAQPIVLVDVPVQQEEVSATDYLPVFSNQDFVEEFGEAIFARSGYETLLEL